MQCMYVCCILHTYIDTNGSHTLEFKSGKSNRVLTVRVCSAEINIRTRVPRFIYIVFKATMREREELQ